MVVNIPAYRMDVFQDGSLVKSYKIGIGYPEFPLPTGLRKAQSIIFNPTWTPPDEPWVAKMKNVAVGERSGRQQVNPWVHKDSIVPIAYSGGNRRPSGDWLRRTAGRMRRRRSRIFTGLRKRRNRNSLSYDHSHFKETKTQVVKLDKAVPVELRYETIVVEDGKLHIYRDVYDQDTNTEENLRKVLEANGIQFEDLSEAEREQVLNALSAMSRHPQSAGSKPSPSASPRR